MTKKVKISFLILVWSIVAVQMYVNYQDRIKQQKLEQENQAVTAFSAVDYPSDGNVIIGQGYFGTMKISEATKKEMLENLAQKLGVFDGYSWNQSQDEESSQIILTGEREGTTVDLRIVSQGQSNYPEQYILVEIMVSNNREYLYELYEKLGQIFEEIGVKGQVQVEMMMENNGKIWKTEKS